LILKQEDLESIPQLFGRSQEPDVQEANCAHVGVVSGSDLLLVDVKHVWPYELVDLFLGQTHLHETIEAAKE
jgi:hypothetical protein